MFQDFYTINNSMVGSLSLNYNTSGCSIVMANVFTPVNPRNIQKGQKIYDYDNAKYFTIGIDENIILQEILEFRFKNNAWPEMKIGTVASNNSSQFPGASITHFRQNVPSSFTLTNSKNTSGLHVFYQFNQDKFNIGMDITEVKIFMQYLRNYPVFLASIMANIKFQGMAQREEMEKKGNGNNNWNKSNQGGGNNNWNNQGGGNTWNNPNQGGGNNNWNNPNQGGGNTWGAPGPVTTQESSNMAATPGFDNGSAPYTPDPNVAYNANTSSQTPGVSAPAAPAPASPGSNLGLSSNEVQDIFGR